MSYFSILRLFINNWISFKRVEVNINKFRKLTKRDGNTEIDDIIGFGGFAVVSRNNITCICEISNGFLVWYFSIIPFFETLFRYIAWGRHKVIKQQTMLWKQWVSWSETFFRYFFEIVLLEIIWFEHLILFEL